MIIRADDASLILTRQIDHAAVSGELAAQWGNESFARPVPFEPVHYACGMHDEAWRDLDEKPILDLETGWPMSFLRVPLERLLSAYLDGAERVARFHPYAGFLVIMHYQGFFNGRFGLAGQLFGREDSAADRARIEAYHRACETLRARWRSQAASVGVPLGDTSAPTVAHAYLLLQVVDAISLFACLGPAQEWPLGVARRTPLSASVSFSMKPAGPDRIVVDPWPFAISQLEIAFPIRRIPKRRYESTEDVRQAILASRWETTSLRIDSQAA